MSAPRKYHREPRDRAVRMFRERRASDPAESMSASRRHVGRLLGIHSGTLCGWIKRQGVSDAESETVRALCKENDELDVPMHF